MNQVTEGEASRRGFLRTLGKTLAAAVGLAALPGMVEAAGRSMARASAASSTPDTPLTVFYHCYANSESCGTGCTSGKVKYHCNATGCASFCTSCQAFSTYQEDYTFSAPSCV